jgi:hypothetical protein
VEPRHVETAVSSSYRICQVSTVLLALCLALTSCASQPTSPASASAASQRGIPVTTRWTLTRVSGPTGTFTVPPRIDGWLAVTRGHILSGRDGCATFSAHEHPEVDGFVVSDLSETANGCLGDHGVLDATRAGFDSLLTPHVTRVAVDHGMMRITAGRNAMTFARDDSAVPSRQTAAPLVTPSATHG